MNGLVLSEVRAGTCILTLNRPDWLNAISAALVTALRLALIRANGNDDVRVIILRGAGQAFCSGNDPRETSGFLAGEPDAELVAAHGHELQEITRLMIGGDKVVIGGIHGWAVGAGFEWAISCDFTVWADNSRAFFPEVSWGLFATGGVTTLLPRIVGINKAREMLLLGEKYGAAELLDAGIAWRVVPESRVFASAEDLARRILEMPRAAVGRFKKTYQRTVFVDLEQALDAEGRALTASVLDAETGARVTAFEG